MTLILLQLFVMQIQLSYETDCVHRI